ncbi:MULTISPECIES: hypothetical protein [Blautia]|uniref:hypothetical protein n=1 Tax=Blautia TaxID=572511 RepID=UPI0012DE019D|nr:MULTISPECIES: hypothetical protein [Blautia]
MKYKCVVCGNVDESMYDVCPKCKAKNAYLPTSQETSSQEGIMTKEEWEKKK